MSIEILRRPILSQSYGLNEPWVPVGQPKSIYDNAKNWLTRSNAAQELINFLEQDALKINLLISTSQTMPNKFWIPEEVALLNCGVYNVFAPEDVLVTWNPNTTWSVHQLKSKRPVGRHSEKNVNRFSQSVRAEIVMIHEFGHARQWLLKNEWYYTKWRAAMAGNNRANLDIEDDNLLTVESVVAKEMGQGVRWHYENNC